MKDVSEEELKARVVNSPRLICKTCLKDGWHMSWCPEGPGPAPKGDAGIGYGRQEWRRPDGG